MSMVRVGPWTDSQKPAGWPDADGCFGRRADRETCIPGCLTWTGERGREACPSWWAVSFLAPELRKTLRPNQVFVGRVISQDHPSVQMGEFVNLMLNRTTISIKHP